MGRCEMMIKEMFDKRDWYEVCGCHIEYQQTTHSYQLVRNIDRLTVYNIMSLASHIRMTMLDQRIELMVDGWWNNDAVNLIIIDCIMHKLNKVASEEGFNAWRYNSLLEDPIEELVEKHFDKSQDPLKDEKLKYFKEKLQLMRNRGYLDRYVPDENPIYGYFALVH